MGGRDRDHDGAHMVQRIVSAQLSAPRVASTTDPPLPPLFGGRVAYFCSPGRVLCTPGAPGAPPLPPRSLIHHRPPPPPPGRLFGRGRLIRRIQYFNCSQGQKPVGMPEKTDIFLTLRKMQRITYKIYYKLSASLIALIIPVRRFFFALLKIFGYG